MSDLCDDTPCECLKDKDNQIKCGCCLFLTGLLVMIICIAVSIGGVEPTEYGILRSKTQQRLTGETKEGGVHWVGIANVIERYPAVIQAVEFSDNGATSKAPRLSTRTKEGLEIQISCAFQYRLIRDDLPKIYRMFEHDYEQKYIRIARSTILSAVSDWYSNEFWTNRVEVGNQILKLLRIEFRKAGAYVVHFNLMKIDLPEQFDEAIIATQIMAQDLIKYQEQLRVEEIKRETENIKATGNKDIQVIQAIAQKNATINLEEAKGEIAAQNIQEISRQLVLVEANLFPPVGGENANNKAARQKRVMDFYVLMKIEALDDFTRNRLFVDVDPDDITLIN